MGVALLASIFSIFFPFLTRILLKNHIPEKNVEMIFLFIGIIIFIQILSSIASYIRIRWGHVLGVRIEYDLRSDMFRHLQKLSFNYFDNVKTGHIMSRITNDLNTITEVAHHAPEDLLISLSVITGAFGFMFYFNPYMALISFIPLPLMLLWGMLVGSRMKNGFREVRKTIADINSSVENSMQGIREVKSYANESLIYSKFTVYNQKFRSAKEHAYSIMGLFYSVMHFLKEIYYTTVVAGGAYFIFIGELDVVDLVAFLLFVGIILPPIERLINFTEQYYQGLTSFERFVEIMDIEPDIKDKKDAVTISNISGDLAFKNIQYSYDPNHGNILKNISFNVKAGESIALVGESGAGKSTLVSLIPRFYEVNKGEILIDNHNVLDMRQQFLRENIGIVQQNVFLFDTTIRENILFGKPDATEKEVIDAAKHANIYDYILTLPDSLDTLVGERGIKLSGGQKQRISIARVFLKNPPILIFDEATSSLDSESERLIQNSMEKLSKNRTTIIIAHRLSTVKHVDKIYVMKDGCFVESGDHKELLSNKGYYFNLYSENLI
jgi:ATP-binding cassette subfamily B protein